MRRRAVDRLASLFRNRGWRAQFRHPSGWRDRLPGCLMAVKIGSAAAFSNRIRSRMDIRRVAERVPSGLVAGIDHSEFMLRQATRRNARDTFRVLEPGGLAALAAAGFRKIRVERRARRPVSAVCAIGEK